MIIQAILIPLVMIIEKLYALNFGKIGFRYHIWEFYLVTNFRKKSEFPLVDIGGPKLRFFLLGRVYLISRIMDLSGLARVTDYWLLNVRSFSQVSDLLLWFFYWFSESEKNENRQKCTNKNTMAVSVQLKQCARQNTFLSNGLQYCWCL